MPMGFNTSRPTPNSYGHSMSAPESAGAYMDSYPNQRTSIVSGMGPVHISMPLLLTFLDRISESAIGYGQPLSSQFASGPNSSQHGLLTSAPATGFDATGASFSTNAAAEWTATGENFRADTTPFPPTATGYAAGQPHQGWGKIDLVIRAS